MSRSTDFLIPALLFVYFFGVFVKYPAVEQLIIKIECDRLDSSDCDSDDVVSKASGWISVIFIAGSIPEIILAGTFGGISDKYGRKIVMLLPCIGGLFECALILFGKYTKLGSLLYWTFIAEMIPSFAGGASVFVLSLFAYNADITKNERSNRGHKFGILEATIGLSAVLGEITAGYIIHFFGYAVTFACLCCIYICLIGCIVIIPESLDKKDRISKIDWRRANTISALFTLLGCNCGKKYVESDITHQEDNSVLVDSNSNIQQTLLGPADLVENEVDRKKILRSILLRLSFSFFCVYGAMDSDDSVMIPFARKEYNWGPVIIGYYDAIAAGLKSLFIILSVPAMNLLGLERYTNDFHIQIFSYTFYGLFFFLTGIVINQWAAFAFEIFTGIGGVGIPRARAMWSNNFPNDEQGVMLAGVASLETIASFLLPAIFSGLFSLTSKIYSGTALICLGITVWFSTYSLWKAKNDIFKISSDSQKRFADKNNSVIEHGTFP